MQKEKRPGARLESAIPYVRQGGKVADIGTDHAYLPIELIRRGIARSALACDICPGPLERAETHIREAGMNDRITTLQTDGLHGVERFCPDDILIFGMGGELIAHILSEAPWVKDPSIGLILQPMSRAEVLRAYLTENGFSIRGETLTYENQYYQTIYATYTGERTTLSTEELLCGKIILGTASPLLEGFLRQKIGVYRKILCGKQQSECADGSEEQNILDALTARLERLGKEPDHESTGTV